MTTARPTQKADANPAVSDDPVDDKPAGRAGDVGLVVLRLAEGDLIPDDGEWSDPVQLKISKAGAGYTTVTAKRVTRSDLRHIARDRG